MKLRLASSCVGLMVLGLTMACGGAYNTPTPYSPPPSPAPSLPDLVITDILLKPKPGNYPDDVVVNTVVRNTSATTNQGFEVWCSFDCDGSITYFSGMQVTNGLAAGQEVVLGDDALLSLSSCSFRSQRQFTCLVDMEDWVTEADENDNELTETLLTGR